MYRGPMIIVYESAGHVAEAVAVAVAEHVAVAPTTVALAGGSTPKATYARLAAMDVDWDRVTLWLGDERWVPDDHPDSNTGMVRGSLGAGAVRLLSPDYRLGDPADTAAEYAQRLDAAFEETDEAGRPGLVLLGMGDDGHTASLFPGTAALEERRSTYVANWVADKDTWRLTATLPLLWSARRIFFIVTGEAKATMVRRIVEEREPFPAQQVAAGAEDVSWFLDDAAASRLTAMS